MIYRIEVAFKEGVTDAAGESVRSRILEHLGIRVERVRTIEVYTLDADIDSQQADFLRETLFTDPIIQESSLNVPLERDFSWMIEVGYRPGVTDNVGKTSVEGIKDVLGDNSPASKPKESPPASSPTSLFRDGKSQVARRGIRTILQNSKFRRCESRPRRDPSCDITISTSRTRSS